MVVTKKSTKAHFVHIRLFINVALSEEDQLSFFYVLISKSKISQLLKNDVNSTVAKPKP